MFGRRASAAPNRPTALVNRGNRMPDAAPEATPAPTPKPKAPPPPKAEAKPEPKAPPPPAPTPAAPESVSPADAERQAKIKEFYETKDSIYTALIEAIDITQLSAMTRERAIENSDLVREYAPLMHEATKYIAHLPIRSRGTIGGSLANADPAAEYPAVSVALDCEMVVRSARGERRVKAGDFFLGLLFGLGHGDILWCSHCGSPAGLSGY